MKAVLQSIALAFGALFFLVLAYVLTAIPYAIALVLAVLFMRGCA